MYSFWLSPKGEIVGTSETHIKTVVNSPEKFGFTRDRIEAFYKNSGERVGQEGEAREKIIGLILKQGWVRVREYLNRWAFTVDRLTPKVRENISDFVYRAVNGKIYSVRLKDKYADATIVELSGSTHRTDLKSLADFSLVEGKLDESVYQADGSLSQIITAEDLENAVPIPIYFEEKAMRDMLDLKI